MVWWKEFLLELGQPAAAAAVVVFLGKHVLDRWDKRSLEAVKAGYNRELEQFRSNLQAAHARQIEGFKHDLAAAAHERNQRISILLEKRAAVAGDVYVRLVEMKRVLGEISDDLSSEAVSTVVRKFEGTKVEFLSFFERHRPFLPREVCALIDAFIETATSSALEADILRLLEEHTAAPITEEEHDDDLEQMFEEPPESVLGEPEQGEDSDPPDLEDPIWLTNPYVRELTSALNAVEIEIRRMLEAPAIGLPPTAESPRPSTPA